MELWVNEYWLFLAYAIGTAFGWYMGVRSNVKNIAETIIDRLVEEKYLKTRGHGKDMEILKYTEWNND